MNKKQTKRSVFFILIFLAIFSCSKDNELENSNINLQDYFVELSQVKEIVGNLLFETNTKASSSKSISVNPSKKTIKKINEVKNEKGKISFYVINYNEGGFVLLSSDKRTQPILAYSEKGKFDLDENSLPAGLKIWIKNTKKQITDIQNSNIKQSKRDNLAWKQVESTLQNIVGNKPPPEEECFDWTNTITRGPLLNTTWNQQWGFNDALPYITCEGIDFQVWAGCVPIAMAQVMKYYEYPTNYNWAAMPLGGGPTTTANFIVDIHEAIDNEYSGHPYYRCDGTFVGGSLDMSDVLKNQFNYSTSTRANYNYNTVKSEISNNRPVILSGDNGTTGHMWVCDGYRQTSYGFADCTGGTYYPFYHMNWGWANTSPNGWYAYNNFDPLNTNYNNNKKMIYNIIP